MRKMISEKEAQLIKQNAENIETLQETLEDVSITEAGALNIDSEVNIIDNLSLGDGSTADSPKITLYSTDVENQGNWSISTTDNQGCCYIQQEGQNTGIKIYRHQVIPVSQNYTTLGSANNRFKTVFLSHYIDWGNGALIYKDGSNRVSIKFNDVDKVKVGSGETYFCNHVEPDTNETYDLGRSGCQWRDLYVCRNVFLTGLPTSDPQVEGQLWNDNGVLKISAGE